jgi:hypothetical protein
VKNTPELIARDKEASHVLSNSDSKACNIFLAVEINSIEFAPYSFSVAKAL